MAEFHLSGDGQTEADIDQEIAELQSVAKDLDVFNRPDGVLVRQGRAELGVMKQLLAPPDRNDDIFISVLRRANFIDEEEAARHVRAYFEAKRLGLDTMVNIAYTEMLCGTNRKGGYKTNISALILESFQHQKITHNTQRIKESGTNSRSPIS